MNESILFNIVRSGNIRIIILEILNTFAIINAFIDAI